MKRESHVTSIDTRKPWQRTAWVQVFAILFGYMPGFITTLVNQSGGRTVTVKGFLTYATLGAVILITSILLLLWFLCGEKPGELNIKPEAWWKILLRRYPVGWVDPV